MIKKFDNHLAKILSTSSTETVECLLYVKNIESTERKLQNYKIEIVAKYPFINALTIKTNLKELKKILKMDSVKFMSSQLQVFALMNIAREILNIDTWGKGENLTIAYIDTGISPHLDFTVGKNRIIKFIDLINYQIFPYDDNGHGTFVAGVGSGNGFVSNGKFAGICPKSNIVSIKALDSSGEANATKILEAMQWIYENFEKYKIQVVCMSFGSEPLGINDPIMKGAEKLWEKGIIVVAAAGNSGPEYKTIKSPGISPKIITVGGFNDNRINENEYNPQYFEIANFSSRGPAFQFYKPDLVAPAVDITSCGINSFYTKLSGTSVATPMVAGLCTLLLQKYPTLMPTQIKQKLLKFCTPITFNQNKEGNGFVTLPNLF